MNSFHDDLVRGSLRFGLLRPFPVQDPLDRHLGDAVVAELEALLACRVDPDDIDRSGRMPPGVIDDLRYGGFLSLRAPVTLGGRDLTEFNAFRAVTAAASIAPPIALTMAIANGLGAPAYLSVLPPGPLRDFLAGRIADGAVSGTADTEPGGAANSTRGTVAVPDGDAYVLHGEKVFAGNGTIADLLAVSASVRDDGDAVRLFFVDTSDPGVEVHAAHQFTGFRGAPNAAVRLSGVRVPRERMVPAATSWRESQGLVGLAAAARLLVIAAPSLAIARQCLEWGRRFAARRSVDGHGLGEYELVRELLDTAEAEVYGIESLVRWAVLGARRADTGRERAAAKNLTSMACWRVVDGTMSLLAAEGYESAASKGRRGADPVPLDRAFRDARGLRIAGGVDFQVDNWAGQAILARHREGPGMPGGGGLSGVPSCCAGYLAGTAEAARELADTAAWLGARVSGDARRGQKALMLLGRVAGELTAVPIALARGLDGDGHDLAERYARVASERAERHLRLLRAERAALAANPSGG
ncbi:hypothetical protein Afil01_03080 [Actinorhabdospora filicis]|uniref:Acyl-CoA dehydrogenase n=1 Tax=Actinorhabdospora filicis TaxID=1785913 RepID=A0A9W6W7H7_9ACTN|nr:acyl-CoA dehydrogenase [Actinorhabdospora filicis]GLZ75501.1 hypothetical protein Afil01_03080 [Actinorhabdospora filicis]